jgi:FSR family fosmidomycin resistance protein-like MFS transporter
MSVDALPAEIAGAAEEERFHLGQLLTVVAGHLIHDTFSAFLNPLLPAIIAKLNLSLTLAGSLTLYNRLPSLLNPFIGMLADRINLRLLVVLAPGVTAVTMSLIGLAPSYAILALLLLAMGLSSAALHVPGPVIVSRVSGRRVGTGMSLWMMAGEMARMVGPIFAVAAVSWWSLDGYYPVMIVGILTSLVLYFRCQGVAIRPEARAASLPLRESWRVIRRLMIPLTAVIVLRSLMRAAMSTFLPTFMVMSSADQSLWTGGTALAVTEFSGALGALAAGTLSDRVSRRSVLFVALLLAPLLMLLFLAADGARWLLYLLLALTGFMTLSTTPVMMAMVQEHGRENPATSNGIYMGINFITTALAAPLLGWMGDEAGLRAAFLWSAILALVAAPIALTLPRHSSRQVEQK